MADIDLKQKIAFKPRAGEIDLGRDYYSFINAVKNDIANHF